MWANKSTAANCGDSGEQFPKVGILASGASKTLTVSLKAGPAGPNSLLAFVDSSCQTTESDEGNNQFTYTYVPAIAVWDLKIVFENNINLTQNEITNIKSHFRRAANFLSDATDGQVRLGTLTFENYSFLGWTFCEVHIKSISEIGWNTTRLGWPVSVIELSGHIQDEYYHHYATIVHELGHNKFDLGDEYTVYRKCSVATHTKAINKHNTGDWVNRDDDGHEDLSRSCPTSIMQNPFTSEYCVSGNHIISLELSLIHI